MDKAMKYLNRKRAEREIEDVKDNHNLNRAFVFGCMLLVWIVFLLISKTMNESISIFILGYITGIIHCAGGLLMFLS